MGVAEGKIPIDPVYLKNGGHLVNILTEMPILRFQLYRTPIKNTAKIISGSTYFI